MEAKGTNGTAIFDGQMLTIRRGFVGNQARGEKSIPLSAIGSVQMRKPSFGALMADGVWSVSVAGEVQSSVSRRGRGHGRDAKLDENSIIFKPSQAAAFQALTEGVNAAKAGGNVPQWQTPGVSVDADREAVIGQIKQLGGMHWNKQIPDAVFIEEMHKIIPRL